MNKEQALAKVSLFANLDPKTIKGISQISTERIFKAGEEIIKQGNEGIGLYIIMSGKVKIQKTNPGGNTIDLAENGPGDILGEMTVLDGAKRSATVTAMEPTTCLVLAAWEFKAFMNTNPEVALEILPIVVKRFRETNDALIGVSGVRI